MFRLIAAHTQVGLRHRQPALCILDHSLLLLLAIAMQKAHQGKWLVRVEDTDIPRIYPGSEEHILTSLEAFQFEPDAEIIFQKIV